MDEQSCLCAARQNVTPFLLSVQDAVLLDSSEEFQVLRRHLANPAKQSFCESHDDLATNDGDQASWLALRDILHALLAPVVALYEHSTSIAQRALNSNREEGFEYAFSGRARNAFVWLQSFIDTDKNWCLTQGCPACVVLHSLDGEESLRLIITSCMLSGIKGSVDLEQPILPSFDFFIRSVAQAMEDDPLWGTTSFEVIEFKAFALQDAMQELMQQCQTIDMSMSPPSSPDSIDAPHSLLGPGMPIRRSRLAEKQARMVREEAQWLKQIGIHRTQSYDAADFASPITAELVRRLSIVDVEG